MLRKIIYIVLFFAFLTMHLTCNMSNMPYIECKGIIVCHTNDFNQKSPEIRQAFDEVIFALNYEKADSILHSKLNDAKIKRDKIAQVKYLTEFFLIPDLSTSSTHTIDYKILAEELLFESIDYAAIWNLTYALYTHYYMIKDGKNTLTYATKLQDLASKKIDNGTTALAYLANGNANKINQKSKIAIRNLYNALMYSNRTKRVDITIEVLASISDFYRDHKMIENALEYKSAELGLRKPISIYDSLEYFQSELLYHDLISNSNEDQLFDTSRIYYIVDFAKSKSAKRLVVYSTAFLRSKLIKSDRIAELNAYYKTRGRDEMVLLKQGNTSIYYSILAFQAEFDKNIGQADSLFKKAIQVLKSPDDVPARISKANYNYAEFLTRHGKLSDSKKYHYAAYDSAKISEDIEFQLEIYKSLSDYLFKIGEYQEAYTMQNNYYKIFTEEYNKVNGHELFKIGNEAEQLMIQEKMNEARLYNKSLQQSQYNLIAIFCLVFFIFFLLLVTYKIPIYLIRILGYISIIFIFEFIILRMDHTIKELHIESPYLLFGIKVVIIAIMLPLHHMIEKGLIKFLIHKRNTGEPWIKINTDFFKRWFNKLDSPEESEH